MHCCCSCGPPLSKSWYNCMHTASIQNHVSRVTWYKIAVLFQYGKGQARRHRVKKQCLWFVVRLRPTLVKLYTYPVVNTRIYDVEFFQLFCKLSSSGSASRLLPWTLQQLTSEKGGKPKPCARRTLRSNHSYQPVSNTVYPPPLIAPFPDYSNKLNHCVPLTPHQTHPSSISYPETNEVSHPRS